MSKYIPRVGEECILQSIGFSESNVKVRMDFVGKDVGCYTALATNKEYSFAFNSVIFRPIPTKADAEREQLEEIVRDVATIEGCVEEIQKRGFTIPKKVKRSELAAVVSENSRMPHWEDEALIYEICELLGDLVESDV